MRHSSELVSVAINCHSSTHTKPTGTSLCNRRPYMSTMVVSLMLFTWTLWMAAKSPQLTDSDSFGCSNIHSMYVWAAGSGVAVMAVAGWVWLVKVAAGTPLTGWEEIPQVVSKVHSRTKRVKVKNPSHKDAIPHFKFWPRWCDVGRSSKPGHPTRKEPNNLSVFAGGAVVYCSHPSLAGSIGGQKRVTMRLRRADTFLASMMPNGDEVNSIKRGPRHNCPSPPF